jgi:hypothetical protein
MAPKMELIMRDLLTPFDEQHIVKNAKDVKDGLPELLFSSSMIIWVFANQGCGGGSNRSFNRCSGECAQSSWGSNGNYHGTISSIGNFGMSSVGKRSGRLKCINK